MTAEHPPDRRRLARRNMRWTVAASLLDMIVIGFVMLALVAVAFLGGREASDADE